MKPRTKVKVNAPGAWRIPPLLPSDNKYTRGHVVILGGAMTGAACLAARAAQRAGAGLVTIAAMPTSWPIYASALHSVISRVCDAKQWDAVVNDKRTRAILIGPGAGITPRTKTSLRAAAKTGTPIILDADAITILASDAALRKALHAHAKILTPHEGEYDRLAKALKLDVKADKPARALALAKAMNAVMVLKGSDTIIADPFGKTRITHPPACLATGGTGDVLAGIIAALVGQGMELFDAASAGVWLHAKAAASHGPGMIAEDVIDSLPKALANLH